MAMRKDSPTKELLGTIERETTAAILFKFLDDNEIVRAAWFPLSQVVEIHHEDPVRLIVSQWIYSTKENNDWK